jgi:hypothetical protein
VEVLDAENKTDELDLIANYQLGCKMLLVTEFGVESNIFVDDEIWLFDPIFMPSDDIDLVFLNIFKSC